jgi:UDP-N-acetylmuramoyl-tripeptide--D-alanyl-D-alanine ligase
VIDESYNANPASMAATLKSLGDEREAKRRIAVLGPMRELGEHSADLHAALAPAVLDARVDCLILIGDEMKPLAEQVVGKVALDMADSVEEATETLIRTLHPGDVVLVKASNSVGLAKLVEQVVQGVGERACST